MPSQNVQDKIVQSGTTIDTSGAPRRFEFKRDTFAFANELRWEYRFDPRTGRTRFTQREPKPSYTHRCFVLTRAARQFLYHAHFDSSAAPCPDSNYQRLIRNVLARDPRTACAPDARVKIPGYASLSEFSRAQEALLKSECGGAWRSYVLRSHWRMVFPFTRAHQARQANRLSASLRQSAAPIVHVVKFPALTINHGLILFDVREEADSVRFEAYDPNDTENPIHLSFDRVARTFSLPANRYWAGGPLDVVEIFRGWFM